MSANEEKQSLDTAMILERLILIENKIVALEEKILKGVKVNLVGPVTPSVIVPNAYGGPPPKVRG